MPLNDFCKKMIPTLILSALLVMGASVNPDSPQEKTKPVLKKTTNNKDEKAKPVHTLFSHVNTLDELQRKLKEAKNEKKPVMIEFYASWCPACRALDAQVLSRASIQHLMRPFVNIRVDLTKKNAELMKIVTYYQVYGTPTFLFYDKHGNEFNTERFQSIDEFKDVLIKLTN